MPSDRFEELIAQVESLSNSYSESATRLSVCISLFEQRLTQLKGKISVTVTNSDGVTLKFCRRGDKWTLICGFGSGATLSLTGLPVDSKTRVVALFEPLLERMVEVHRSRREQVENALEHVSTALGDRVRFTAMQSPERKEGE